MKLRSQLVTVSDAYCAATRLSRSRVSTIVLNRGATLDGLAEGRADVTTGTFEKAMRWFLDNWPDGAEWPRDVDMPVADEARP